MAKPSAPSAMHINHTSSDTNVATKNVSGKVDVSAVIDDPNKGQHVRLYIRYSTVKNFSEFKVVRSQWHSQNVRVELTLTGLSKNTFYYVRAWTQDYSGNLSASYNSGTFWTNRYPNPPLLISPAENLTFMASDTIGFHWEHSDPDPSDSATKARVYWREAATPIRAAGEWLYHEVSGNVDTWTMPANTLKASTQYEWRVRTRDEQDQWGDYSLIQSISTGGLTKPPTPLSPGGDVAVTTDTVQTFKWRFNDPNINATQGNADLRYRVIGTPTWITIAGALSQSQIDFAPDVFVPGYHYEWQVRTYRSAGVDVLSDWSNSSTFWTILTPGSLAIETLPDGTSIQGELGQGGHRVFVYDRGGMIQRGEITGITMVRWNRVRDDISSADVFISGFTEQMGEFLGSLRTWAYEIVIFRGKDRVWEGPITHLTYTPDAVSIGAKDVMVYAQRRVLRQGYNDSYHVVKGVQLGLKTVVSRAGLLLANGLGYADPNVLPYLTMISTGDDARQSRIVPDYTKLVWEEIDDMAANAGLDYTTIGRRIILWDTHNRVGVLPEMRDNDFSEPCTVTEYGMNLANFFAVTDGNGGWGSAYPAGKTEADWLDYYGPIEMMASGYGDSDAAAAETLTPEAQAAQKAALTEQARRNINGRWPGPLVARVPDNATINPEVSIGINQFIPGVWIPLVVQNTVRPFKQMQKLDSLTVTQDSNGEQVTCVMSPAPLGTLDPDGAATNNGGDE